ncbi:MAG: hypothetical protein WA510_26445, partial [Acidobacteriaceae bacterium]
RISRHAAPDTSTYAPFLKERRMKLANAANLNGKSGVAKWRDLQFTEPAIDLYRTIGSHADTFSP